MFESPPGGVFTHNRPEEVDINEIDLDIRGIFYLLEKAPGVHTTLMCQGHPESEKLFVWGTDLEVRLVFHIDIINDLFDFKELLIEGYPSKFENLEETDKMFHFIHGTIRDQKVRWEMYDVKEPWHGLTIKFEYDTIGQRNCFIEVMEEAIDEVFL